MSSASGLRYEQHPDRRLTVRSGTQTNCSGIAEVTLTIQATASRSLAVDFSAPDVIGIGRVAANQIARELQDAFSAGALDAYAEATPEFGLHLVVLAALVHLVDATPRRFHECGQTSVKEWLRFNSGAPFRT